MTRASRPTAVYADRRDAGRAVAARLAEVLDPAVRPLVLGLPRGGVPVAYEVAARLRLALDVLVVRKLGAPGQPELALGAIAGGGVEVLNDDVLRHVRPDPVAVDDVRRRERDELARRERTYRDGAPAVDLAGRSVVIVDDGLATGATMRVAVLAARERGAADVTAAAPVGAPPVCAALAEHATTVVCLHRPAAFSAVGPWYRDFTATADQEVVDLLRVARAFSSGRLGTRSS